MSGKDRRPDFEKVVNGRLCRVWRRRSLVEVLVFAGEAEDGVPVAEWDMPYSMKFDLELAAVTAERQTDR